MSEIEPYTGRGVEVHRHQNDAVRRLSEWAESAVAASQVAAELVRTSFVPESFRGKPQEATGAILAGIEVGLQPMAALRAFDIIQGQAAPRAITLRAIVQSHGHEMVLEESTATRARMRGRRSGTSEWQTVTWTLERAQKLGLANKPNWKNQPQAMLVARVTSELARLIAADAILGIGYTVEEIADGAGAGVEVAAETARPAADAAPSGAKRMSRRKPADRPELLPPAPDDEPTTGDPTPPAAQPTAAQMKALHASLNDAGVSDRDDRLAFVTAVIGRPIDSSKNVTGEEAGAVIDAAKELAAGTLELAITTEGWKLVAVGDDERAG